MFELENLATALRRKLLNLSGDIRRARKNKLKKEEIQILISSRKAVDKAYSSCVVAMLNNDAKEREKAYRNSLECYKQH